MGPALGIPLLIACVPSPILVARGVAGRVVDAESEAPLEGAIVVVRYEGSYDDVLPERRVLGYREARTDREGRFRVPSLVRPGLFLWPLLRIESWVATAFGAGHLCADTARARPRNDFRVALVASRDDRARAVSCRPIDAGPDEVPAYMNAWRSLHLGPEAPALDAVDDDLDHLLEARVPFGFGANCTGPVLDLALAPGGDLVAFTVASGKGAEVHVVDLAATGIRGQRVATLAKVPARQLGWSGFAQLVLHDPLPAGPPETAAAQGGRAVVLWTAGRRSTPPAAPRFSLEDAGRSPGGAPVPLDAADLNDPSDTRLRGRGFAVVRALDPETGLLRDRLRVSHADGALSEFDLPGEACGPPGRFGRPQDRIAFDGRSGVDLRYVDDGCRALRIDLTDGSSSPVDATPAHGTCRTARRVPVAQMTRALRGYVGAVRAALDAGGGEPSAPFSLHLGSDGTWAETRTGAGMPVRVRVPDFPIATPLRRLDVGLVGSVEVAPNASRAIPGPQPIRGLEPL
jgi:hypothetical protein